MARKKESPFALAAFTIAAGLLIGCSVLIMNQLPSQILGTPVINAAYNDGLETFQADNLRFSIKLPQNFDKVIGVQNVNLMTTGGRITVGRTATDSDTLTDYLNRFDSQKNVDVKDEKTLQIDGYDAVTRLEYYRASGLEEKVYDIFVNGWVYSFTTSDKALYNDLDRIATTFTYLP